jgi:hypothetical protein
MAAAMVALDPIEWPCARHLLAFMQVLILASGG